MEKKEKNEKGGMPADLSEKADSPTKNLKTKENKFSVPAVPKAVEQGKTVALNSNQASTQPVSKAGSKERATSPVKSRNASPAKSSDVKTSSAKSSDVKSRDGSPAKTLTNLGNKKKADAKQSKEKGEPLEKLAKVVENKKKADAKQSKEK